MIKFNWEEIRKHTKGNIPRILEYFTNVYVLKGTMYDYLLNHKWAAKIHNSKKPNNNYILNIDDLILDELGATDEEKYIYLDLASRREALPFDEAGP
jgi:hypothetical protein